MHFPRSPSPSPNHLIIVMMLNFLHQHRLILILSLACVFILLPDHFVNILAITLIVLVGLPHGLLDPWLINEEWLKQKSTALKIIAAYTAVALAFAIFWWLAPTIACALFILISAQHFGQDLSSSGLSGWQQASLGLAIIAWPIAWHPQQAHLIFEQLGVILSISQLSVLARLSMLIAALILLVAKMKSKTRFDLLQLQLCLAIVALLCSPFVYFALYFCCLHSWQHFSQHQQLCRQLLQSSPWPLLLLFVLTIIFLGLSTILFLSEASHLQQASIVGIFYLLAALTMPHMIVIWRWQQRH